MNLQVNRQEQPEPARQLHLERCIEQLCEQGCQYVLEVIRLLWYGKRVTGLAGLDVAERALVPDELTAIMSVYEGGCDSK
jgi:hypothetical protein